MTVNLKAVKDKSLFAVSHVETSCFSSSFLFVVHEVKYFTRDIKNKVNHTAFTGAFSANTYFNIFKYLFSVL